MLELFYFSIPASIALVFFLLTFSPSPIPSSLLSFPSLFSLSILLFSLLFSVSPPPFPSSFFLSSFYYTENPRSCPYYL